MSVLDAVPAVAPILQNSSRPSISREGLKGRVRLRKARLADARRIGDLVNFFADREEMLHRSSAEICANIRDYFVVELEGETIACSGLQVNLDTLAEVKSLAVDERYQGLGLGSLLVEACVREAEDLGVPSVFALTYRPAFFERLGFRQVHKSTLPRKVWGECIRCPKFPDCGEIAVLKELAPQSSGLVQL